jgi:hypothetical protein
MGCIPSRNVNKKIVVLDLVDISKYPRQAEILIKSKDSSGKLIGNTKFAFKLSEPVKCLSENIECLGLAYWVSSCVLPGLDPRGHSHKICQDDCVYFSNGSSIILGLFDGHGSEGDKVSKFCCNFVKTFYYEQSSLLEVREM